MLLDFVILFKPDKNAAVDKGTHRVSLLDDEVLKTVLLGCVFVLTAYTYKGHAIKRLLLFTIDLLYQIIKPLGTKQHNPY